MIDLKRANGFGWMTLFLTIQTGVVISPIIIIIRIAFFGTGMVNGMILTAVDRPSLIFVKRQLLKASAGIAEFTINTVLRTYKRHILTSVKDKDQSYNRQAAM